MRLTALTAGLGAESAPFKGTLQSVFAHACNIELSAGRLIALVARGKLDQVGDVGRVERLDEPASGLVIALVDRVQDTVHEFGAQPVFGVDGISRIFGGRGGDLLALAHVMLPSTGPCAALLWSPPLWRNRCRIPKSPA